MPCRFLVPPRIRAHEVIKVPETRECVTYLSKSTHTYKNLSNICLHLGKA